MKFRLQAAAACLLLLSLAGLALVQSPSGGGESLAAWLPRGPLLTLEARDFRQLLDDWDSSREQAKWLASDNYRAFSQSRLFLRLQDIQKEYATPVGFTANGEWLSSVAGGRSILGLYDIGKLQFLYITKLPSARSLETVLWQKRADFEPRTAHGRTFYLRQDTAAERMVAFATTDDYLVIATREDLIVGALGLMFAQQGDSAAKETWHADAISAAEAVGSLRMVLNMDPLTQSSYMRSFWIQRNVSELRPYRSGIVDVHRSTGEIREERVFLPKDDVEPAGGTPSADAVPSLLRLAPAETDFLQAWASPAVSGVSRRIRNLLDPAPAQGSFVQAAPGVTLTSGRTGTEAALEIQIDEKPRSLAGGGLDAAAIDRWLQDRQIRALLQLSKSTTQGLFVEPRSVIILLASLDWEPVRTREALLSAVESLWTTSRIGVTWAARQSGGHQYHVLEGLNSLTAATIGPYLVIANSETLTRQVLERMSDPPLGEPAHYFARLEHLAAQGPYLNLMRQLDYLQGRRYGRFSGDASNRNPAFFSENLGGLSTSLERVQSVTISGRQDEGRVLQTVRYGLAP